MARGINKVIAIGNLGGDPEMRFLPSGAAVANFSIAVSEQWKDKQTGETKERTEWIRCEVWGKAAEACAEYLHKGSQAYIEGRMRTEQWDDKKTGEKRYATKVRVDNVQFLGSPRGGGERPPVDRTQPPERNDKQEEFDDDIPF